MTVSFIIPTKDRPEILNESLGHLIAAVKGDLVEIIVVNDSKTSVPEVMSSSVRVLNNPGKGVASARNFGAAAATGNMLWFLDDDIWINNDMYLRGLELIAKCPGCIFNFNWEYPPILQEEVKQKPFGRYLNDIGYTTMKGWCKGMPWQDNDLFITEWLAGATLLIPAEAYHRVKGYDPGFPLAGFEDYDFSVRVRKAGIKAYIDTTVCAHHNEVSKTSLKGFMQRTFNNAVTRRHGVEIGYKDHRLEFGTIKRLLFNVLKPLEPVVIRIVDRKGLPSFMDPVLSPIYKYLIGSSIYRGYTNLDRNPA